jgi:hypothetical protein
VIQAIDFRFGGGITITAGSSGPLLALLGPAPLAVQVPLGGSFADGPVTLSLAAAPGPIPIAGAAAALAWSRRLRRRLAKPMLSHASEAKSGGWAPPWPG